MKCAAVVAGDGFESKRRRRFARGTKPKPSLQVIRKAGFAERPNNGERWLRGLDLNQRPSGYEPDELPDCSTPRHRVVASCRDAKRAALAGQPSDKMNGFLPHTRRLQCLATTYSSNA